MSKRHTARQASIMYISNATLKRSKARENRLPGPQDTMSLLLREQSIYYAYRARKVFNIQS